MNQGRSPRLATALLLVVAAVPTMGAPAAEPVDPPRPKLLLGPTYPIEVSDAFHVALLHWLDSLAGLQGGGVTAGKTIEAHRAEYTATIGPLGRDDRARLEAWGRARLDAARGTSHEETQAVTVAFFEAPSLGEAIAAAATRVEATTAAALEEALIRFAPQYRKIWKGGTVTREFLARVGEDPGREALAAFLLTVASFYGVDATAEPLPHIHLVPVPGGGGTHAQAIGRHLLIEVRSGEGLIDQVAPIVHENAHLLFLRMDPQRAYALDTVARGLGARGNSGWLRMREALPTAIGQGVAARRFSPSSWSTRNLWYHRDDVDRAAKRIYPLVDSTLADGGSFDEAFLRRALAALN